MTRTSSDTGMESRTLLDCPTEVLFEICFHLTDHNDLLHLSQTSRLIRHKIRQFTRVATNHDGALSLFRGFMFCQRTSIFDTVPDWSINLVELLYGPTMTPVIPNSFYGPTLHVKNYVALVVPTRPKSRIKLKGEYSLMFMNWSIKRLTNVFSGRFVLITPEPTIQVLNRVLENTTIRAPEAETVLLTQVDYIGDHPLFMAPKKLTLDTCTTRLLQGICFDKMEYLRISAPSRGDQSRANFHFQPSSIADQGIVDGLHDLHCPSLKALEIRNINHLTNLDMPQLTNLYAVFTTYSQQGPVIPKINNVSIPEVCLLDIWSYEEVPIISNVNLPKKCSHFCINFQPTDKTTVHDDTGTRWSFDIPQGKKISAVNGLSELSDSNLKNVTTLTTSGLLSDLERLTSEDKLELPALKSITIHDTATTSLSMTPSLLNISAHSLDSLSIARSSASTVIIDLNSMSHDFPNLQSLTISGIGKNFKDVYLPGLTFPSLKSLFLYSMSLETLVDIFDCFDLASIDLKELKLDRCITESGDDASGLVRHLLRSIHGFKESLVMLDISLTKNHPSLYHSGPLKLENFTKLRDLTLNVDVSELELRECNKLKEINLSYRDTPLTRLTATSLPVLEKLSYNVSQHDEYALKETGIKRPRARSIQEMCDEIEHFEEWGRIRRDIHMVGGWALQ